MSRKLILTPFEHGYLEGLNNVINDSSINKSKNKIDIAHVLCSSLIMAGVDKIESSTKIEKSKTKLITEIDPLEFFTTWESCTRSVKETFDNYKSPEKSKKYNDTIDDYSNRLEQLIYASETNSGVLTFSPMSKIDNSDLLPIELKIPFEILLSEIQTENANLPILKYDLPKKDFNRLLDVINGKEYEKYAEAQSEIDVSQNLTSKTIKSIELAGKELYKKNKKVLNLRENLIKAIPMSSKLIELFFGKLPGILSEYSGKLISNHLEKNKMIPIYNCQAIITYILKQRLKELYDNEEK